MKKFHLIVLAFIVAFSWVSTAHKKEKKSLLGIRIYEFEIEGRPASVAVWYPAIDKGEGLFDYNKLTKGSAYLDATPDRSQAPYPLIVFSHGMGGCGFQSVFYVENLARAGYVVGAMDHKDSGMCLMQGKPKITQGKVLLAFLKGGGNLTKTVTLLFKDQVRDVDFTYRPRELKELIDHLLELNQTDPALKGLFSPEKIGATGHSLGGFTALAIAGGEFDCQSPEKYNPELCARVEQALAHREEISEENMELIREPDVICCLEQYKGKKVSFKDPRVDAVLPLGPAVFFPEGAFKEVSIPIMIITGWGKFEVPFEPIQRVYDELAGPRYLLHLKKVDHMTITDMALKIPFARLVLPGYRWKYKMKKQIYENYSRGFFDAYLKGDQKAKEYIKEAQYPIMELQASP